MSVPALLAATLLSGTSPQALAEPVPPPQSVPAAPTDQTAAPVPAPTPSPDPAADQPQPDITIVGSHRIPGDPLAAVNEKSFALTASIDNAVGGPLARKYKQIVPKPIRSGIRNFFNNLHEPVVFFNFLLQHKFGKAAETLGRFALNSTIGIGGLADVAKTRPFRLPRRQNGFADTLGFYGVKPGPFFYVPVVGPTTLRDLAGGFVDRLVVPMPIKVLGNPAVRLPSGAIRAMDHRAEIDDRIRMLRDSPENNYDASRDFYLKRRQAEIDHLRGKPVAPDPVPAPAPAPK